MLFHTIEFALFFLIVFPAFELAPHRFRWVILLTASLVFFGALGVPELLLALVAVTLASYGFGFLLGPSTSNRRAWLWAGIGFNVLVLSSFKYLPAEWFGRDAGGGLLALIGVSYFTFQGISYLVDVHSGAQPRERHLGYFALYMAFFPKVLQGPIERAGDLLPQLRQRHEVDTEAWRAGAILFAWGLFKKVVVADRAGPLVDSVYGSVSSYEGLPLVLGTYLFGVQLYCDFSGYTDMALGAARCFGIRLTQNFNNPYAARSIVDFWRRWHISFSRWILDYIFKPLQFTLRRLGTGGIAIALVVTFFISGIWHGAGGTFIVWGVLHGLYMTISVTTRRVRDRWRARLWRGRPTLGHAWQVFVTVHLVILSWVFFRAESLSDAQYVLTHIGPGVTGTRTWLLEYGPFNLLVLALGAVTVAWVDMMGRTRGVERLLEQPAWLRWPAYQTLALAILLLGAEQRVPFVYFYF